MFCRWSPPAVAGEYPRSQGGWASACSTSFRLWFSAVIPKPDALSVRDKALFCNALGTIVVYEHCSVLHRKFTDVWIEWSKDVLNNVAKWINNSLFENRDVTNCGLVGAWRIKSLWNTREVTEFLIKKGYLVLLKLMCKVNTILNWFYKCWQLLYQTE